MLFGIFIGVGVSIINTRLLGPQQYGDLKFLQNLFSFFVTPMTLGIFVSGARLLAQRQNETQKQQLIGSLLLLATILSLLLIICMFIFSYYQENIFGNRLGHLIRVLCPLLFVVPFKLCLENIMKGDNKIYELSTFRILPMIIYLGAAITFNFFVPLSLASALSINLIAAALVTVSFSFIIKPRFNNIGKTLRTVWEEIKSYGFHVYIGILFNVATVSLGALVISFIVGNINLGYFSLAKIISDPLRMIPVSIGTTFFKDFANSDRLPPRVTFLTICVSIFALFIFILLIKDVVLLLYSQDYIKSVSLCYFVSCGAVLQGIGGYFNNFVCAHGGGKFARNAAIAQGTSNIIAFSAFVYLFGVMGAAIATLLSGAIYLCAIFYYYRRLSKQQRSYIFATRSALEDYQNRRKTGE